MYLILRAYFSERIKFLTTPSRAGSILVSPGGMVWSCWCCCGDDMIPFVIGKLTAVVAYCVVFLFVAGITSSLEVDELVQWRCRLDDSFRGITGEGGNEVRCVR